MPTDTPTLLTREQAAEYLGVTADTLAAHATRGSGPQYAKLSGRAVRYRRVDLDAWVESKLRTSTKDLGLDSTQVVVAPKHTTATPRRRRPN